MSASKTDAGSKERRSTHEEIHERPGLDVAFLGLVPDWCGASRAEEHVPRLDEVVSPARGGKEGRGRAEKQVSDVGRRQSSAPPLINLVRREHTVLQTPWLQGRKTT